MNTSSQTLTRLFSWQNWFSPQAGKSPAPVGQTRETVSESPIPVNAPRILVVDDDEVVRKATEMRLKAHGYAVTTAADGPAAILAARTEQPDVILLDICFPPDVSLTWDGFRILAWLHRMESTRDTPIILVTGSLDRSLAQRALEMGAGGFFHKPLNFSALLALIDYRLKGAVRARMTTISDSACEI